MPLILLIEVYNSFHTLHVYIVARFDFSWGDAQFHQETLGNLKVAMKSTNKLCAFESTEFYRFTQLQSSLLQSMKSGSICPVYKILYRRRGMNHDNFLQKILCNLITCRIWFGQPLMPYRWNKLRVLTISVVDFINKVKYKTNPTDLCKISIYGSMLWTLLNLWTSNFSASSIIYPTSLCMELLHLQSY
ncbi:unnamed protein product [Malus baccata var. baccata]